MAQEQPVIAGEASGPGGSMAEGSGDPGAAGAPQERRPSWWQRDHPTFVALAGFYTGLAFTILIPGTVAAVLATLFEQDTAERMFPLVLITLVVPLALLLPARTRRFAQFMWIGIVSTFVVVVGVAALVFWILVKQG